MRFDTPIFFQVIAPGEYDAKTGDYAATISESKPYWADVTDTGAETVNLIYGALRKGVQTVRLQMHYNEPFDRIRIGATVYRVDFERRLRSKHVFVVSEV